MDYGALFSRTWQLVWQHKFLLVLGILVALGSGQGGGGGNLRTVYQSFNRTESGFDPGDMPPGWPDGFEDPDFERLWQDLAIPAPITALFLTAFCVGMLVSILLWLIALLGQGGLIHAAGTLDAGGNSNLGAALQAGWQRKWPLLGINLIASIPGTLIAVVILAIMGSALFTSATMSNFAEAMLKMIPWSIGIVCLTLPLTLAIRALVIFASRACLLDQSGVRDSFRRGWQVLKEKVGSALVLYLIQLGLKLLISILLILPTIVSSLCSVFWPLYLVINGALSTYFETMWTLAWREWTQPTPRPRLAPEGTPR